MSTFSKFSCAAVAGAALTLLSFAAQADSGLSPTAQNHPQRHKKNCMETVQSVLYADNGSVVLGRVLSPPEHAPQWRDANGARWSPHVQNVLQDGDNVDMDGVSGPCRLVDGDVDSDYFKNDGLDVADLLKQIDQLMIDQSSLAEEGKYELLDPSLPGRTVEISPTDHQLHIFSTKRGVKTDLGRLGDERTIDALAGGKHDAEPGYPGRTALRKGKDGNDTARVPAVPEPSSYAMLLAGLGLIGVLARRKPKPEA